MHLSTKIKVIHVIFLLLFSTLFCQKETQETIAIPDSSFLQALIDDGIDKDNDGAISMVEASKVKKLTLWPANIYDLSGLEKFEQLDSLSIQMNPIKNLDLSANTSLRFLECIGCELESLNISKNKELRHLNCSGSLAMGSFLTNIDVSKNQNLEYLKCNENKLTDLDVSNNLQLTFLSCGYNKINRLDVSNNKKLLTLACNNNHLKTLDISANIELTKMISCGNELSTLNVSNNQNLAKIGFDNMPGLTKVCVWTMPFPPEGVGVLMGFSPNVYFTLDCTLDEKLTK